MNLRQELEHIASRVEQGQWAGHEHVRGYGVFGLPLTSGHTLALRVFPINDFAPYMTVWHQDPEGTWSIFYDAPRPDTACPRYYGDGARMCKSSHIRVEWRSQNELLVQVDAPMLEWSIQVRETPLLKVLNGVSARLPFWTWKHGMLLKPREWIARWLGMGEIALAGIMPSGHFGILMPQRMYFISRSRAVLDGIDLGEPAKVRSNPKIGQLPLPARGMFAIGQAHWEILDEAEYHQTRAEMGTATGGPFSAGV